MDKRLKIGIVGCGAIGSSLAKAISKDFSKTAKLVALFDSENEKARDLSIRVGRSYKLTSASLRELINKSELVIESSSAKSSFEIAKEALTRSRDIMIMSVGGVIGRLKQLTVIARDHNSKVYIPSGAISGVDALKAIAINEIKKVTLTTRKNPASFKGVEYVNKKGIILNKIKKDTLLFSGSAKDAVKLFPQNVNVAGILSLAGIGEEKTRVKIIASADTKKNIHEIEIESKAAKVFTRTENILHPDNPKTSYLAVLSAIATLKQILEPVKIGT